MDIYCPIQGMGEQPLPLGKDFSLIILSGFGFKAQSGKGTSGTKEGQYT